MGVAAGFGLAVSYDVWKRSRDAKNELLRATRTIEQEITTNLDILKNNSSLLSHDTKAADSRSEIFSELTPLFTAAGDTANSKGSFEKRSMDLALSVREVYAVLTLLNAVIQGRALYRATSGAMSNYGERRKFLNQQIETMSETAREALEALLTELKSLH